MENRTRDKATSVKHYSLLRAAENVSFEVLEKVATEEYQNLKGEAFKQKTKEFKALISKGKSLEDILVDAFATAYRAVEEMYGISLYRVQIMGGYTLHHGDVAEMKTGEGKTLTAILPAYLNALEGKGVHVITVNEYLSTRDAYNVGKVFAMLGLTTGNVTSEMENNQKREEYGKDITYMTNSEVGFDHLRDNLVKDYSEKVQRGFNYVIIDEVDSILIDEARTPLIISGGTDAEDEVYLKADDFVLSLKENDYEYDKESNQAYLTPEGAHAAESFYSLENLYEYKNSEIVHRIHNALQAHYVFKRDVDYAVKDDEIVLIDIFTGRFLEGRQYSEGLNQAIEAKERIKIKPETKTFASVTYQNLFRMYKKISGMSGTAVPEAEEFMSVYNMRVIPIPTNRGVNRNDLPDRIYATIDAKFNGVIEAIKAIHETGQPILVGTRSVDDSEMLSRRLNEQGIRHEVLNAKNNAREAEIIAKAGQKNAITISTNMAGRGTDIKLGEGVIELGGLYVIGTERHESRRIDDQLRGRSGRQGDIGISQFYVSLDDEIMRRAGMKKLQKLMSSLDDSPIESKMVAKSITSAQKRMEGMNYDSRKSVIEYDDVLNSQRLIAYKQRDAILTSKNLDAIVEQMIKGFVKYISEQSFSYRNHEFSSELMIAGMMNNFTDLRLVVQKLTQDETISYVSENLVNLFHNKFDGMDTNEKKALMRSILIYSLDQSWQDHIDRIQRLRSGIRYRQYAQKNPVQAFVLEAEKLFDFFRNQIMEKGTLLMFKQGKNQERAVIDIEEEINSSREIKEILVK